MPIYEMIEDSGKVYLRVTGATITYKNFSGIDRFNSGKNDRNFSLVIDENDVMADTGASVIDTLQQDGWTVKLKVPKKGDPFYHLSVSLRVTNREWDGIGRRPMPNGAMIKVIRANGNPDGDICYEEDLEDLDNMLFKRVDLYIYRYEYHNITTGVKAILHEANFYLRESMLAVDHGFM